MTSLFFFYILKPTDLHFVSFADHLKGEITQRHIRRAALGKTETLRSNYLPGLNLFVEQVVFFQRFIPYFYIP